MRQRSDGERIAWPVSSEPARASEWVAAGVPAGAHGGTPRHAFPTMANVADGVSGWPSLATRPHERMPSPIQHKPVPSETHPVQAAGCRMCSEAWAYSFNGLNRSAAQIPGAKVTCLGSSSRIRRSVSVLFSGSKRPSTT